MDLFATQILGQLWSSLWWVLLLFIGLIVFKLFKPFLKGKLGEFAVATHVKLYGLFVIETKNYKGWIFGGERQKTWTQKLYKNSYKFQNPIHQNYKHIKVLEQLLADIIEPDQLHSVIVFMPDAVFKTPMPNYVFRGAGWTDYVKSFNQRVISDTKIKRIQIRLEKEVLEKSRKTNREHVANLNRRQSEQKSL